MSLIIIGSNHVGIATATMTTALPGSPRIGDLVLAFWHVDAGTFSSAASGFTALTSWANNGRWYYKFLKTDADISQTNSWTLTGGTYEQYMEWFVIRGADNSIAPTALFLADNYDSTPESDNTSCQRPRAMHIIGIHLYSSGDLSDLTWATGYTHITSHSEGADNGFGACSYREITTSGAISQKTMTLSSTLFVCNTYSIVVEPAITQSVSQIGST